MCHKYKSLVIMLLAALVVAGCGGTATPTPLPLTAQMSELQGEVTIKQPEQDAFSDAYSGAILQVGGQVRTGEDGRVRLDLSSGTIIRVAPISLFTLESNEQSGTSLLTRLTMEAGQIWIVLRGGSMEVDTPSGLASVRGSYLSIWVDPVTLDVWSTCLEGNCICKIADQSMSTNYTTGQGCLLFHFDPTTGMLVPPQISNMSLLDLKTWFQMVPEAQAVYQDAIATITAMASIPTSTPTPTPTSTATPTNTVKPYTGKGNTTFTVIRAPNSGQTIEVCKVVFKVEVSDPDGVQEVFLKYSFQGYLYTYSLKYYLTLISGNEWGGTPIIPAYEALVTWQLFAVDGLGHVEDGPKSNYTGLCYGGQG